MNSEIDIYEIAYNIFSNELKDPNSIMLQFPDVDTKELIKLLMVVLTEGLKYFHGDNNGHVNLSLVTADDFKKINKYFNSFGFNVYYNITFDEPHSVFPNDAFDDIITLKTKIDEKNIYYNIAFSLYKK